VLTFEGLTETTAACHCNPLEDCLRKIGSIGVPLPHVTARIVDSDMKDVPVGQPGELLLKSPSVMRGYWRNAKATEGTFTSDGWYKTGDVAQMDEEGYF
jgi:long-subunit acyl-CoA synthetase (AMP-forming)